MTSSNTAHTYYELLGLTPTASPQEIRRTYRDMSKLYHPDTTTLPPDVATAKFQALNEAYATLSSPDKRVAYDYSIGISKVAVIQAPRYLNQPSSQRRFYERNSAYLDPTDRPLSAGELFALFILGVTFVSCLVLVFAISWTKGELVLHTPEPDRGAPLESQVMPVTPSSPSPSITPDTPAVPSPSMPTDPPAAPRLEKALPSAGLSTKII